MTGPECAILVMGFNRPQHLARVLATLQSVQPRNLYVALDGPRPDRPEDRALIDQCRALVDSIDWPCDVRTQFQSQNLGCGRGVSSALTWFFDHEERGIILEDDVVPDPTFFDYSIELLSRYEVDPRIFAVSGSNVVPAQGLSHPEQPYRFSHVPHIWGWATWRRSWDTYRFDIVDWREHLSAEQLWNLNGGSMSGTLFWGATFDLVGRGAYDTWDAQLVFASMCAGQLNATANVNLTENIGFSDGATHTFAKPPSMQPVGSLPLPLDQVPVEWDERADAVARKEHFLAMGRVQQAMQRRNEGFREFIAEVHELSRRDPTHQAH